MFLCFLIFYILLSGAFGDPVFDYSGLSKQQEFSYVDHNGEQVSTFEPNGSNSKTDVSSRHQKTVLYNWGPNKYHGTEGVNYHLEEDGRTPYILCNYYIYAKDGDTVDHQLSEDGKTTKCYMNHNHSGQKFGCSAMFDVKRNPDNSTTKILRRQSCWVHQMEEINYYCNQKDCIQSENYSNEKSIMCCCNTNGCNSHLSDKPQIMMQPFDGSDFDKFHPTVPTKKIVIVEKTHPLLYIFTGIIVLIGVTMVGILICKKYSPLVNSEQEHPLVALNADASVDTLRTIEEQTVTTDVETSTASVVSWLDQIEEPQSSD